MAVVISVVNEKGGVGKTTTVACLGSILASKGYRVLLLDFDPQSDLSVSFPIELEGKPTIFDCMFEIGKLKGINVNPNLVLIPGSPYLNPINYMDKLRLIEGFEYENPRLFFRHLLRPIIDDEKLIVLIDCPPNREVVVQSALSASHQVLIPTFCHNFSYNGIWDIIKLVKRLNDQLKIDLDVLGVLINNYDQRNNIDRGVREMITETFPSLVFKTAIRTNTKLKEASHLGLEITKYNEQLAQKRIPQHFQGYADYDALAYEIIERLGLKSVINDITNDR